MPKPLSYINSCILLTNPPSAAGTTADAPEERKTVFQNVSEGVVRPSTPARRPAARLRTPRRSASNPPSPTTAAGPKRSPAVKKKNFSDSPTPRHPRKEGIPQRSEMPSPILSVRKGTDYNFGPAATNALPASLPVNFTKFLMKRPARSFAFSSHLQAQS